MTFPHLIASVFGTGIWRPIRITVLAFTASAVFRLIPLPRPRSASPAATRRHAITAMAVTPHAQAVSLRPGLGVFVAGAAASWQPVTTWSRLTGIRPGILTYYSGWGNPFPVRLADQAARVGTVPLVQMEPGKVTLASIAAGRSDAYLEAWAAAARAYRYPLALSFAPEANGPLYRWGCRHAPASSFIAAWRHVHQVVSRAGAANVIWVWDVNRIYPAVCPLAARWPGDTYSTSLAPTVAAVRALAPGKPVLVAETGARRGPTASAWIHSVLTGARRARLIAVIWFNYADRLGNYKLQDNPPALSAYRKGAAQWSLKARATGGSRDPTVELRPLVFAPGGYGS